MKIREQGWECPKCRRVWAPKITSCGACNYRQTLPVEFIPQSIPTRTAESFTPQWDIEWLGGVEL